MNTECANWNLILTCFQQIKAIPHPSFAAIVGQSKVDDLLKNHLQWRNKDDDSLSEILVMPVKSNADLKAGHHVPMFPMPQPSEPLNFFVLFLGSVTKNRKVDDIREYHRRLFKSACDAGGKRYSYDTITHEVRGVDAWKKHYSTSVWHQLCLAKREYDPFHVLGTGIGMWE